MLGTGRSLLKVGTSHDFSFLQVDLNRDRLVNLDEFLKSTQKKEFNEADGWKVCEGPKGMIRGQRKHTLVAAAASL